MKYFFTFLTLLIGFTLKSQLAVFKSITSGNYNAPSTWTLTSGSDADGIPDETDSAIVRSGHVVKLTAIQKCRFFSILSGGTLFPNSQTLRIDGVSGGAFHNAGTISGGNFYLVCNNFAMQLKIVNPININGSIYFTKNATINAGANITTGEFVIQGSSVSVTNNGTVYLTSLIKGLNLSTGTNAKWINAANSSLTLNSKIVVNGTSTFDFSATSNTVTYLGNGTIDVVAGTYHHLNVSGSGTKQLKGNITVNGNMAIYPNGAVTLTFSPNGKAITLSGNISNTAQSFSLTTGSLLTFTGTATTQTVSGTRALNFYDVTINKPNKTDVIVCANTLNVSHELNVIKGTCNSGSNNLVLLSDASTTARLATITNTVDVDFTGSMVIQRFYPAYSKTLVSPAANTYRYFYHDLSSPVKSTTVMDWDNEIFISGIEPNDDGVAGPAGVDGLVPNLTGGNNYSMNRYNENTDTYTAITGSLTTLTPGKGYDLLLLDDNNNGGGTPFIWNAKIIDSRGVPNFGDVAFTGVSFTNGKGIGYNLVGNPYPSPITLAGNKGGNWNLSGTAPSTINANIFFPDGATGTFTAASRATTTISPHQGFWIVRTNAGGASLTFTFKESSKVASYGTNANFMREAKFYDIKLSVSSAHLSVSHECEVNFNSDANLGYDDIDAPYKQFLPIAPNIYFADASEQFDGLVNNYISSKADEVALPIRVFSPQAGMYTIDATVLSTDAYNYVWIENLKTGEKYDINKSITFEGKEQHINTDYVLRLTKKEQNNAISKTILNNDLLIFNSDNTLNLKSTYADHQLSEVMIYDVSGKLILQENNVTVLSSNVHKIDLTNIASGLYIVKVIDNSGQVLSKRIIK